MTVVAKTYRDGYRYRCMIKDADGHRWTTEEAELTVEQEAKTETKTEKTAESVAETSNGEESETVWVEEETADKSSDESEMTMDEQIN